jgi:hypothetical protein
MLGILLENSLFGNIYSDPIGFSRFRSTVEVIFLNAVEYRLRFPVDVRHFQNVVPSVSFSVWETKRKRRGLIPASREDRER